MNLSEFLLARIAEDEEAAKAASPSPWRWVFWQEDFRISDEDAAHIARWDPARVLAECKAKRRIVGMHEPGVELCYWSHDSSAVHDDAPCRTLRLLAQPFADHPDFDPEWRL